MVLPLLLAGPTSTGETLEDLIAEHKRRVNIIRQSTARLYDAIPSQQPRVLKSRVKNMVSHSNLTSSSPRTEVRQEHQQEQNPDLKPGLTDPQSPIDTAFRICTELLATPLGMGSSVGPVRILDLGGLEAGLLRKKPRDAEFCDYAVHTTNSLASLPYPDACLDIFFCTALAQRCSIQTFGHRYGPQSRTFMKDMRDCLVECHRLLVPGGRLEYIFFQDGLMKAGPLITDIEHFL
uniref:Uncharacterized protein n=1 Tax=Bionectria ochroleuca TaxID=29856 RepID=A0A0B7KQZ7_BIOOC